MDSKTLYLVATVESGTLCNTDITESKETAVDMCVQWLHDNGFDSYKDYRNQENDDDLYLRQFKIYAPDGVSGHYENVDFLDDIVVPSTVKDPVNMGIETKQGYLCPHCGKINDRIEEVWKGWEYKQYINGELITTDDSNMKRSTLTFPCCEHEVALEKYVGPVEYIEINGARYAKERTK